MNSVSKFILLRIHAVKQ